MTGYGKASGQGDLGVFEIEVRSVNSRFFDFYPHLPREWAALEIRLREFVRRRIARGKVDLWVRWTPPPDVSIRVELSGQMVAEVARRFGEASEKAGIEIEIPWGDLFKIPGFLTVRPPEIALDALFDAIESPLAEALDRLDEMRRAEGRATAETLAGHLETMRRITDEIERLRGCVLDKQRERLRRLVEQMRAEVCEAVSSDRLEAEVLLFADRADISEEIARLRSHYDAFEALLRSDATESAGKRLEFITQEIFREANTIGSKARDSEIASSVVTLKHETEKVREQVQNIE